MFMKIDTRRKW